MVDPVITPTILLILVAAFNILDKIIDIVKKAKKSECVIDITKEQKKAEMKIEQ